MIFTYFLKLMNQCMSSNPTTRPNFDHVNKKLQVITMDHSNLLEADFGVVSHYCLRVSTKERNDLNPIMISEVTQHIQSLHYEYYHLEICLSKN